ncbi:MAG: hypothetical protein PVI30_00390 [Myxococcales bacterium]|jgi:hypothetical protein
MARQTAGRLLALALLAAFGCQDVEHTVGTVDMEAPLEQPGGSGSDAADMVPAPTRGSAGDGGPSPSGGTATSGTASPTRPVGSDAADGDSAPPITTPSGECAFRAQEATNRQLGLYLMVDSNITLPFTAGWDNLTSALVGYAEHPRAAGTRVGVRYFGIECEPMRYAAPTVPMGPLPGNADRIAEELPLPFQFSPMLPALEGAIIYARSQANADPTTKQAVVFVTDGFSTDLSCLTTPDSLESVAAEGLLNFPSIETHVIALATPNIPNPFDPTDRIGPLDAIAASGGTESAHQIDLQAPSEDIVDALLAVQVEAEPCEYAVPADLAAAPDTLALSVTGSGEPLPRVSGADACGGDAGFYFDDPDAPGWAFPCPQSCEAIRDSGARPRLLSGCEVPTR